MVEFSTVAMDLVILCIAIVNHFYFSTIASVMLLHGDLNLNSGLQIEILRDTIAPHEPPPILVYHGKDDCIWEIKTEDFTLTPNGANGHRLPLQHSISTRVNVTCAVNGTELLDAIILTRG